MADIVKYTCVSAVPNHKRFQRIGAAVRASGASGKKSIVDGYITSTTADRNGSITTVIDTPIVLAYTGAFVDSGVLTFIRALPLGVARDAFVPSGTGTLPVKSGVPTKRFMQPAGNKYVGLDTPMNRTPLNTGASGRARIDGQWAIMGFTASYRTVDYEYISNLNIYAVRWSSPIDSDDQPYESEAVIAVTVPVEVITGLFPDWKLHQEFAADAVGTPSACAITRNGTTRVYVTTIMHNTDVVLATGFWRAILTLGIDIVPGREQTLAWAQVVPINPYVVDEPRSGTDEYQVEIIHTMGAAEDGTDDTVETVCVYNDPGAGGSTGRGVTLIYDATDGTLTTPQIDTSAALKRVEGLACSTKTSAWGGSIGSVNSVTSIGGDFSTPLLHMRGGVRSAVSLDGWLPACIYYPGMSGTSASTHVMRFVTDLSPGRVGIIVSPAGTYTTWGSAAFHLIEVDEDTLTVISVRGFIGNAIVPGTGAEFSRHMSTVTPQVVEGGVVTTPAVLLCNIGSTTRVSTDGGYTWRIIATGSTQTPVYMGNRLHAVTLGESL